MKELKDYLHLYLGCEMWEANGHPYKLTAKQLYSNLLMPSSIDSGRAKPILRPLSDMTEEEAIELAKLSEWEPHFRDVKTYRNQFNDIIVHWDGMCETREEFNATGELFYCSEQFQWLLKKGFDLFELILEGLAIDKTKQPA